jgi:hypothetical protein
MGLWIIIAVLAIVPQSTNFLANFLGIGSGINLIFIFGIIGAYYLIFRLYLKIEKFDQDITKLVRLIAIENGECSEEDKDKDD